MPVKKGVIPNMGDVTPATRVQLSKVVGGKRAPTTGRKRRPRKATMTRRKKRTQRTRFATERLRPLKKRAAGGRKRLRKGSAAAKAYMAKLRKMRK